MLTFDEGQSLPRRYIIKKKTLYPTDYLQH